MNQIDFFEKKDESSEIYLSISEASIILNVSEASIRNWIKCGYLKSHSKGFITKKSFSLFYKKIIGKQKLNKRANKQYFDNHNHIKICKKISKEIDLSSNFELISNKYENNISNSYKNKQGLYYTPEHVCKKIFSDIPKPKPNDKFLDPCCGTGNFLLAAIEHGFKPENTYGFDIDELAIKIAQKRVYEKTGFWNENIQIQDYLRISIKNDTEKNRFDVIVTNPPWGQKIPKEQKEFYGKFLGAGKSLDSCSLFMFAALNDLEDYGTLAFLMPESFFNVSSFRDARQKLLQYKMMSVRDFDKPFKGLLTKAKSFCISNKNFQNSQLMCTTPKFKFTREQSSFLKNPFSIINFTTNHNEQNLIERIYSKPYITLKDNAKWGLGIVTGNNKKFCKNRPEKNYMPVYRGSDIHKGSIDTPKIFIPNDLSLYQQVAPKNLYENENKIIYKFISSKLIFHNDLNKSYFLNSVNMLIPDKNIFNYKNLISILNSELYNWVFSKLFGTHKILRTDLETLPISTEILSSKENFSEQKLLDYYGVEKCEDGTFRTKK